MFWMTDAQLEVDARLEVIWGQTGPKRPDDAQTPGGPKTPNTCQTLGDRRISNRWRHQEGGSSGRAAVLRTAVSWAPSGLHIVNGEQ